MLLLSLSPPSFPSWKSPTLSCLSLVFCRHLNVKCARHISGWGNIMSGYSGRLCPPSSPTLFPSQHLSEVDRKLFVGWDQCVCEASVIYKGSATGKWAKLPQLLQWKTQEESLCFCCDSIRGATVSQLHGPFFFFSLLLLFSLVSFTMSHCEDYPTDRSVQCPGLSPAQGHTGWDERCTINREGWRENVLQNVPST